MPFSNVLYAQLAIHSQCYDGIKWLHFQNTLQVLNISGNNLDSIKDLEVLKRLTQMMASDNFLIDMKELAHILGLWPFLWRLELMGNPVCHKAKYRDRIIVMSKHLGK